MQDEAEEEKANAGDAGTEAPNVENAVAQGVLHNNNVAVVAANREIQMHDEGEAQQQEEEAAIAADNERQMHDEVEAQQQEEVESIE